jgi:hypothetical protein
MQPTNATSLGFRPAFLDFATCAIYLARHRDGRVADFHSLDGLPEPLVTRRPLTGRVTATKPTLIAGFERNGYFFTRAAAARAAAEWTGPA